MGILEEESSTNHLLFQRGGSTSTKSLSLFYQNGIGKTYHTDSFVFITLLSLVAILLYNQWKWQKRTNMSSKFFEEFPGPKPLPFLGNAFQLIFKPTEFYDWSWGMCKRWGDTVLLWRIQRPMMYICKYETAIDLLSNNNFIAKSQDIYKYLWNIPGGNGLSSSPAHLHNSRRKLLYPGYTRQVVEGSMYIFCEETKRMLAKLEKYADTGKPFEITEVLIPCSFRISCRSAFGDDLLVSWNDSDEEALEQMHALHTIEQSIAHRIMSPNFLIWNDFIYYNLTPSGVKTKGCMKTINEFGLKGIDKKRRERKLNATNSSLSYLDLLLDLLDAGKLDESDILGELNNYIAAGYDTTALAIAWTLFALALNPRHHQDKIYDEVIEIINGDDGDDRILSTNDTKKMKYLELSIKEAFRLFPVSPILPRSTTQNTRLKDGRVIPSGTDVFIMVDMIHRDPRFFPEPEKFIPERHLEPVPAFLPFSTGVRNCIGQVFAMHQMKTELAYLIKEFIWETEETPEAVPRLFQALMVPAEGIHLKITRRKN